MPSFNSLVATQPDLNATVSASAGSGKTWLLVTRIIRLLLEKAEPGNILALTFTRKAASEMQIRLYERLYAMAIADENNLIEILQSIGADTSTATQQRAQNLYEEMLHALYPVRLKTFHSFCQDILSRFPLEADVPPGFELMEDTSLLEQQAWESLFTEATNYPDGALANELDILMQASNGPPNTRKALSSMLQQRSDWWAYTENQDRPAEYAIELLQQQLDLTNNEDPVGQFFSIPTLQALTEFSDLLDRHKTKTNLDHATCIRTVTSLENFDSSSLKKIQTVLLTAKAEPRVRKSSKAQIKSMGDTGETRFLELHTILSEQLLQTLDVLKRKQTFEINRAWYRAGHRFIEIFQRLKRELRMLDFADLEWSCYQLLNTSDNALWVQYKTDQRIDHFLIDEFQDTNPTQWQLLSPLFEEIAANPGERWRTVFLVGDKKQSIYSFRRANPMLQSQASAWLQEHLSAQATPLDYSWRSSPAIIDFVNRVFSQPPLVELMPDFVEHGTHLKTLPGKVTLYPLCKQAEISEENTAALNKLRNPLLEPRPEKPASAYTEEAEIIARHIQSMIAQPCYINDAGDIRAVEYSDIMILMRARKHAEDYEQALRNLGIPFVGDQQGTLLENLEIQDLEKLLDALITPFDNLAIAQVLKSPIFSASDEDLILLAQIKNKTHWYEKLSFLPADLEQQHPLRRASTLLPHWRQLADTIPVHDLLDKIYAEGNLLQRYASSVTETYSNRVQANLQRFLELSLELDSGRYPSLSHFLHYLRSIRKPEASSPDEPIINTGDSRVRLMTIHSSKGLEAPVVFLADCNRGSTDKSAFTTLVQWPASSSNPDRFQLVLGKENSDSLTQQVQQKKAEAQDREQLNLLYVALTRAREYLIITGVEPKRSNHQSGWYAYAHNAISSMATEKSDPDEKDGVMHYVFGAHDLSSTSNTLAKDKPNNTQPRDEPIAALRAPVRHLPAVERMIAPSKAGHFEALPFGTTDSTNTDIDTVANIKHGQIRGIVIHRALDLLSRKNPPTTEEIQRQLASELGFKIADSTAGDNKSDLFSWIDEAKRTITAQKFREIFVPEQSSQTYNELSVLYKTDDATINSSVYGIIDRLVVDKQHILLIDYKTHSGATAETASALAESFTDQMNLYRKGVQQIWPDHTVRSGVLFTACEEIVWLD